MNNQDRTASPKRRWLRYSLRTFFVLLTVTCVWLGLLVNRVNKQRESVIWVREKDGYVYYDYQVNEDGQWDIFADEPGPDWLRERIGIDYFADVAKVEIYHCDSSDLSPLAEFSKLESLELAADQFDDLSFLKKLTRLKSLTLGGNIRDLWIIGELPTLQSLIIGFSSGSAEPAARFLALLSPNNAEIAPYV